MTLAEREAAYRERQRQARQPVIVVSMHVPERDVNALRPRLEAQGVSLSEHVRSLIHADAGMPVAMMEVR